MRRSRNRCAKRSARSILRADTGVAIAAANVSSRMRSVRQSGTKPELAVRGVLRELRIRYRTKNRDLPGSPDLANRRQGWAVFVHGCFWHQHAGCRRATFPKTNRAFWQAKFDANTARDARSIDELRRRGFDVCIIWECEAADKGAVKKRLIAAGVT